MIPKNESTIFLSEMKPSSKTHASEGDCFQYETGNGSEPMAFIVGRVHLMHGLSILLLLCFCSGNPSVGELRGLKLPIISELELIYTFSSSNTFSIKSDTPESGEHV